MKYNVLQFITNTAGNYTAKVSATFDDLSKAKVNYHSTCAAFNNADDVLIAVIKLVDEYGNPMDGYREVIDHTPEPEPEEDIIDETTSE